MDSSEPHNVERDDDDTRSPALDLTDEEAARYRRRNKRAMYTAAGICCFFLALLFSAIAGWAPDNLLTLVGIDLPMFVFILAGFTSGVALFFRPLVYLCWRYSAIPPEGLWGGARSEWGLIAEQDLNLTGIDVRRRVLLPFALFFFFALLFVLTNG